MQGNEKPQQVLSELGGRLRRARNKLGLTQEVVAAQAGLSLSTLSKIETGTSTPTLDALIRIARVLGETPDQLLEWKAPALSGEARKRALLIDEVNSILAPVPLEQLAALVALLRR